MHPTARFGLALVVLFSVLSSLASAATGIIRNAPVVIADAPLPAIYDLDAPASIDLDAHYAFTPAASTDFAKITTPFGDIYVEFLADDAPKTVENFKYYLATDSTSTADLIKTYDDVFVHRLVKGFVLQTGGYKIQADPIKLLDITKRKKEDDDTKDYLLQNEFKVANTRGTLAMAKVGNDPDSATNEWFINLADNRANLDIQNGGFTVFARVMGDGMAIADRIAALKVYDVDANNGSLLDTVPLRYNGGNLNKSHFINLPKLRAVSGASLEARHKTLKLAYSIIANSNPQVATATINATGALSVRRGKMTGHTYMTLRVQAVGGHHLDVPLTVVRTGAPLVVKQLPATTTAALGTSVTLAAKVSAWPLNIQWQFRPTKNDAWTDIAANDARFSGATTETLTIKLTGANPAAIGQAFALNNHQIRFRLTNAQGEKAGTETTLRITTTLGFQTNPTSTVTSGTAVNGKLGATLTAPLGATVVLSRPALPATYPAPTYQWQRQAPGSTTWEPLVNSAAAVAASGSNPAVPAVASPYSGVNTANLTIRLNGPETPAANSTAFSTLATIALHQSQYRCVITHDRGAGAQTFTSPTTTLRISAVPLAIATQPAKLVYGLLTHVPGLPENEISVARISVAAKPTATNTPAKYQWQARLANTTEWVTLVNHKPATPANGSTPASPEVPTPYKGVDTATLVIRFPADKNLASGYGLKLDGAQYRCVITNVLKDAPAPFTATAGPVVSAAATLRVLAGTVSLVTEENFRFPGLRAADVGVRFSAKGLPKGLTMNPETGVITGVPLDKPGVFKVVVTILEGSTASSITYYSELLPLVGFSSGSYEALLSPANQPPLAKLSLTVAGNGTLTGTLATAEEKNLLPLKGAVVRDVATGVVSLQDQVVIARPAVPGIPAGRTYVLTGLVIPPSGTVSVKLHTRQNATAPLVELAAATSIRVANQETGDPGLRLSTYTKADSAPWANISRYTLAFTDPTPLAPTTSPIPSGSGYATATMAPDGKLSLRGKLGDGTVLTATLSSDLTGDYRLFVRPYDLPGAYFSAFINTTGLVSYPAANPRNPTFLRYTVAYSLGNTDPENDFDDGAQVFWRRPAPLVPPPSNAKPVAYSAGFPPLGLRVRMEPWYYTAYEQLGFQIAADLNSATMDLVTSGAGMNNATPNSRDLPTRLRLTIDNKGKLILKDATQPDNSLLSGTIDNITGLFKGELTLFDKPADSPTISRKVPFEGVLLVPPEAFQFNFIGGFFPVPVPTPVGKITAEGLGLVPALPGGTPATSRFTLDKSPPN